jgi:ribose transport system substrate-binding protein
VFHYGGNDWSNAQLAALKAQFATEGVDVVAVTDRASSRRSRSPT